MILVDTSVWVAHWKASVPPLATLLNDGEVLMHPAVVGELAMGNLANRDATLATLQLLPSIREATHAEVLRMIEARTLYGTGIGYVDAQLLAAALAAGAPFFTRDKRAFAGAQRLGIAHSE